MIQAFILWESRTTRTRIQLDTTRNIEVFLNEVVKDIEVFLNEVVKNIEVFLNKVVNTIIWTRNNNRTIMDNSLGLEQECKTRGQTGIQIDRCGRYMTKYVRDLISSNMELDVV